MQEYVNDADSWMKKKCASIFFQSMVHGSAVLSTYIHIVG